MKTFLKSVVFFINLLVLNFSQITIKKISRYSDFTLLLCVVLSSNPFLHNACGNNFSKTRVRSLSHSMISQLYDTMFIKKSNKH